MELTDIQVKNLISNILNEGYWGHLPLENDSALDEFGEVAYNNIGEQLKNIDKNWNDKLSVFTYLGVIMYMLQIYNFFYSLKSLDKKFDFTNKINKAIKYIDDEKFINTWDEPEEVRKYIKKLPNMIKEILDKNSLGSDNFKKLKVAVPCNEGKNYVNMNVDVREGGRHAVKMTEDEFKQEMIHVYHMYAMEQEKKYKYDLQLTPSPDNFVYSLCYNNRENEKSKYTSALYNDIWNGKYKFDSENVDAYGGIKMSKKGFPYIQCAAGGDWECPVCFFVYFDGNKFRGYVPLKGNAINRNEKHAFSGGGNEPDAKFVQKELGIDYEEADHMCGDIDYNVDACLEDFLARVEVKGTYKKRDYTKDEERFKEYRKEKIADEKKRSEEAELRRQMNAQENNGEPDGSEEINETVRNILKKFVFEATATGTGGLPGEFTVPFPGDDETLDRTPGDTMGMHDRVGKSNLEESVVTLPVYLYHKSPRAFRKSILANGLLPKVGDSYQCHYAREENLQPLIFLYDHNTVDDGEYDSTYDDDIYRINTSYLDKELLNDDPAGMNGCFTYPEPIPSEALTLVYEGSDEDSDDLSRHSYIYNIHEGKKVVKNDEGEVVPEFCKKCGGKVGTYICGEPIYKCSECGEYYGTVPFTLGKKKSIKESKQTWRDNPLFTIGKYKGMKKIDIINEKPDYCLWLHRKAMDEINNTPFSPKELALLDIAYYKKHKEFPIRSPYTPKYAKINGKYVSEMNKDELQYVYEHGNESFKWIVKQEHMNRGWEKRNWHDIKRGALAFQSDDVGDEAWMNR